MAKPPIVVFDLDGTLAETAPDIMRVLNLILVQEGLAELPIAKARELVGAGARALIERGFKSHGQILEAERLERLFGVFLELYAADIAALSHLFDGVEAAMDVLEADGFRFGICTNKPIRHSLLLLDKLGVTARFAAIAGRDSYPFFKPDPRHLTETIAQAGGDPGRAVMVGDSRTDIDTARAAGIPVVAVPFGYTDVPIEDLMPDIVIQHFSELPGAVRRLVAG